MRRKMKLVPHVHIAESAALLVLAAFLLAAAGYLSQLSQAVTDVYNQANIAANSMTIPQSFGAPCTLADNKTAGRKLTDPDKLSSVCIPDGWQLYMDTAAKMIIASAQENDGLTYERGVVPALAPTSGRQGPFTFQLHDYRNDPGAPAGFVKVGSFRTVNATGIEYAFTQKADPVGGYIGNVPKGTKSTEYYFEKQGHAVVLDYWLFPGDSNHAVEVQQVALSLTLF